MAGALALAGAALGLQAMDRAYPPHLARLDHHAAEMQDRTGRLLAIRPAQGGVWRLHTTISDIDPDFITRLIAVEDQHFFRHPGVNPLALLRAAFQDVRAGRIVSGGSTLTMQVARLLEPRPRTIRSKLIEIARALQLEAHFSKTQILEMWLTLAPYGGNLEGVRAGSLAWLGTQARHLEPAEIALLVAIPRRPEALRPDRHALRAEQARNRILGTPAGPVIPTRQPMPRHADLALPWPSTPHAPIRTTLDLGLQIALEHLARDQQHQLPANAKAAFVVADLQSREILALTSGDGTSHGPGSRLDLTRAIRSPGSALKPFIYAMAFEAGLAGPATLLDDLPRRFGGYAPENFDRAFQGRITMEEALRRSLNLPAVALLSELGPAQFLQRLRSAGIALKLPTRAAGAVDASLPLALGGAGITLRDATTLYAALGTDGLVRALSLQPDQNPARSLIAQRAAAEIAGILTQNFPEGGPAGVAWKTGTSWGGRDAWSLGFDRRHVAGVWVGRPDGAPMPGATGRSLALPLLSRVMALLPEQPRSVANRATAAGPSLRADALHLLFPPPDATISADGPITLRAMGGRRPLVFLVDGVRLITEPARRDVVWQPRSPGFYHLTVLDADGQTQRSMIRIR